MWLTLLPLCVGGALCGAAALHLFEAVDARHQDVAYGAAEDLAQSEALGLAMQQRSANARGYLLSADPQFLEGRRAAHAQFSLRLAQLRARHGSDRVDGILGRIAKLAGDLDEASDRAMARRPVDTAGAVADWSVEVRPINIELSSALAELVASERSSFEAARANAAETARRSKHLLGGLVVAVTIAIGLLLAQLWRTALELSAHVKAEHEHTLFRLLEQIPVGIFVLRSDGTPYYANPRSDHLLGRPLDVELHPDSLGDAYGAFRAGTDEVYPPGEMPIVRALGGVSTEVSDMEIRTERGVIPLHVSGGPVYDADGKLAFAVAAFQDIREMQRVALRDTLTGLVNRAAFTQSFLRERLLNERAGNPMAIALIDLDHFKAVNDAHGHAIGDRVLARVASAISDSLRRTDVVCRWGGEELAVLLPGTDLGGARCAVEKALDAVRRESFTGGDRSAFSVTFSAGAVVTKTGESLDSVVARADTLLYAAKRAGRNRVMCDAPAQ